MTNNPITLDKEYQTRDGRPVRVHATDIGGFQPVLASCLNDDGEWVIINRLSDGRFKSGEESDIDLVEKPKTHKIVFYVNVYSDGGNVLHKTRQGADRWAGKYRIACKRIEIEVQEGEFDE